MANKPDQRIQETTKPILQPHLGREQSQQSYLAILSQWNTHPPPTSEINSCLAQNLCPNRRPKDITSRQIQKPELS